MSPPPQPERNAEIVKQYVAGASITTLAKRFGLSWGYVGFLLTASGQRRPHPKLLTSDERARLEQAVKAYVPGTPLRPLAEQYKASYTSLYTRLLRDGVYQHPYKRKRKHRMVETLTPTTKRMLNGMLRDCFDATTGSYRDDTSDASLAAALDLDVAIVASYRDENYGPLAVVETDVDHLRAEIHEWQAKIEAIDVREASSFLDELNDKIAQLDAWRKELGEWRDVITVSVHKTYDNVVQLRAVGVRLTEAVTSLRVRAKT